jgi:hypothetical protein
MCKEMSSVYVRKCSNRLLSQNINYSRVRLRARTFLTCKYSIKIREHTVKSKDHHICKSKMTCMHIISHVYLHNPHGSFSFNIYPYLS